MAVFTSFDKNFEVTAISFSPNIITIGEKTNYSITVKNISGKRINTMYATISLYYRATDGKVHESYAEYAFGGPSYKQEAVAWANGATKTFTGSFAFTYSSTYPPNIDTRLLPLFKGSDVGYPADMGGNERLGLMLSFTTDVDFGDVFNNGDMFFDLRGANSENLYVIDARYRPAISAFSAERSIGSVPDDEGENFLADIRLKCSTDAKPERLSLRVYYQNRKKPDESPLMVDVTSLINGALAGEVRATIAKTLDKASDWDLVLRFGDSYEFATSSVLLSRSFANVHLSGASTGGVCFGSFSKATEGKPSFQCYYPSEFYAPAKFESGIHGVSNYEAAEVEMETGGKWIDGRSIYRRVVPINVVASTSPKPFYEFESDIEMIALSGYVKRGGGIYRFPPVWWTSGNNYHSIWMDNAKEMYYQSTLALDGHLIIDYVKPN